MRSLSSVTLATYSSLCAALLLTACGGNSSGAGNSAGSAGTDATGGSAGTATAGSGGSGTAGSGGSGVAGTGGGGTAGSAGSAGGGAAGSAGSGQSYDVSVVLGAPGEDCSPNGQLACGGIDNKVQLICSGGKWDTISLCSGTTICDPREGSATLGTCVDKDPLCPTPGALSCDGKQLMQCDQTQLGMAVKETCQACDVDHCIGDPCPDPLPEEFVDTIGDCSASCSAGNSSTHCLGTSEALQCNAELWYGTAPGMPQKVTFRTLVWSTESCVSGAMRLSLGSRVPVDPGLHYPILARVSGGSGVVFPGGTRCVSIDGENYVSEYDWSILVASSATAPVPVNIELDWSAGANCP